MDIIRHFQISFCFTGKNKKPDWAAASDGIHQVRLPAV